VTAAQALSSSSVTLKVAGSTMAYNERVTVDLPAGDGLVITGTGPAEPTINDGATGSDISISTANAGPVTVTDMAVSGGKSHTAAASTPGPQS